MPDSNDKISRDAERKRYIYIAQINSLIEQEFNSYSVQIVNFALNQIPEGVESFAIEDYPTIKLYVDNIIEKIVGDISVVAVTALNNSWEMSIQKNDAIIRTVDVNFIGSDLTSKLSQYRQEVQSTLSNRIYKDVEPFIDEINFTLNEAVQSGTSSQSISSKLIGYLKNPKKVNIEPGSGIYKSPTKNIQRLTRQVINNSYRNADTARWNSTPIILGFEVRTSESHPREDICDNFAGEYPTDFIFSGWHVQCLCYSVPKLMSSKQFSQYQQLVLSGNDTEKNIANIAQRVEIIPDSAYQYILDNQEKIDRLKTRPYFLTQNEDAFKTKKSA